MQIVIDIPEELTYKGFERPFTEEEKNILIKAIGNGTPPTWIPTSKRPPKEGGEYLVTQKSGFSDNAYRSIAGYSLNLHNIDKYDFADKKRPGWYKYDSDWGYYEIDGVIAWMPLPEPYKAESEDKE